MSDINMTLESFLRLSRLCVFKTALLITGGCYMLTAGVMNNTVAGGCNDNKWREGWERTSLPAQLKTAGYRHSAPLSLVQGPRDTLLSLDEIMV